VTGKTLAETEMSLSESGPGQSVCPGTGLYLMFVFLYLRYERLSFTPFESSGKNFRARIRPCTASSCLIAPSSKKDEAKQFDENEPDDTEFVTVTILRCASSRVASVTGEIDIISRSR